MDLATGEVDVLPPEAADFPAAKAKDQTQLQGEAMRMISQGGHV